MRIEIHYLGLVVEPLKLSYKFNRKTDKKGKPSTMVLGGGVKAKIEVNFQTIRFLEEILTINERCKNPNLNPPSDKECYKKTVIKVFDHNNYNIRTLELLDSYIANFKEVFTSAKARLNTNNINNTNNHVNLEFRSASQIINKGVAKNVFGWWLTNPFIVNQYKPPIQKTEEKEKVIPKVIVDFRPSKNYDGEYGLDYMRSKDKEDKLTYKDILGTNREFDKTKKKWIDKFKKYPTNAKYNNLKKEYKTVTFSWYKDAEGKAIEYLQSWLTLYPNETQTLSLQINTIENPKDLTLKYNKDLFKLNTDIVPAQKKGKKRLKDHLTIECLKEFDTNQTIKVMLGNTQFGQLNILANAKTKRKKVKVVFVVVETNLKGSGKNIKGNTINKTGSPEREMLERYLKQAYIKLELVEKKFNLTQLNPKTNKLKYPDFNKDYSLIDTREPEEPIKILNKYNNTKGGDSLAEYMEKIYNAAEPKYKDYFKVFFFGEKGGRKTKTNIVGLSGHAKELNSLCAIMYVDKRKATVTHELLHCMGLQHSFSSHADYSYKKEATQNIMDYSKIRKNTWLWQWKKLWENTDIKNE